MNSAAAVLDHPPLRAIARFLELPPASVAPTYLLPSEGATLSISTDLEALLSNANEDLGALPLLTPTALQVAAVAMALAGQRLLPFPCHRDSLQQLVGLMQQRVLASTHLDPTFADRTPLQHFRRACDHFFQVRRSLSSPAASPAELLGIRHRLADFAVYLAFATYASVPLLGDGQEEGEAGGGPPG